MAFARCQGMMPKKSSRLLHSKQKITRRTCNMFAFVNRSTIILLPPLAHSRFHFSFVALFLPLANHPCQVTRTVSTTCRVNIEYGHGSDQPTDSHLSPYCLILYRNTFRPYRPRSSKNELCILVTGRIEEVGRWSFRIQKVARGKS